MDTLINKQYKNYNYISRYTSFPYYYHTIDRKYIYGTTSNLNKDTVFTVYTVKPADTLDLIALEYYNNPTLFWVIADFNDIHNPYDELEVGSKLNIPTLSNISFKGIL